MRSILVLFLVMSLFACSSGEDMALLHREITDVQRSVEELSSATADQQDLRRMEERMQQLTDQNMRSNADLAMQVESLQERMEALHSSLELTTRRLQEISQELSAARARSLATIPPVIVASADDPMANPEATNPGAGYTAPAATGITSDMPPEQLYRSAYEDYMRGNFDLAAQGFQEYIRRFPDTDLTDNALYWVGECYDAQELTAEALEIFTQVLADYANSDKAAAAQLKMGLLYLKSGDQGQGVVNLQYVVYEHPGTQEADLAREKLRSLGLNIR